MARLKKGIGKAAFVTGMLAGAGLAAFLWIIESVLGEKVFVLLLNVDFIPYVNRVEWSLIMELIFHLIISWVIAALYTCYLEWKHPVNRQKWFLSLALSLGAGFTYFPLSLLAIREVPSVDNFSAIVYWFMGHTLYAVLLKKVADWIKKMR